MSTMTLRLPASFALTILVASAGSATATEGNGWYSSLDEAQLAAKDSGQPLLIHFHASWCGPCQRMNREVFNQHDVQQQLRSGIAAVEVDVSRHGATAQRYGATTVPRDVVVFPDGTTQTMHVGFMPRNAYLSMLAGVADRGREIAARLQPRHVAEPADVLADDATNEEPQLQPADRDAAVAEKSSPLGLDGFCPVQLHDNRQWVKGKSELTAAHHGIVYRFSGQAELQEFQNNKDKYAPQNLGCDSVVLLSDQRAVSGKIEFGAFFDDRLYLFDSQENRKEFKSNPLHYTRIRHALKVDQVSGKRIQFQ